MGEAPEKISVTYDISDLRAVQRNCALCRTVGRGFAAILLLLFVLNLANGESLLGSLQQLMPYILAFILAFVIIRFVSPVFQLRTRNRNGWNVPMQISLRPTGVAITHPIQDSNFHWEGITKIEKTEKRLLMFTSPNCAIILPRRCFESQAAYDEWIREAQGLWDAAKARRVRY